MSKNKNVPAYLALVIDILTTAQKLGLEVERDESTGSTLPENGGYCFVYVDGGDAAMIVPKHGGEVKWCDSHIDWEGKDGYEPIEKANGAVLCRVIPSELNLGDYLKALSGASRRKSQRKGKASSQALAQLKATLLSIGLKAETPATPAETLEPASETPAGMTEDDLSDMDLAGFEG